MSRGRKVGSAYPIQTLNRWFAVLSALFLFSMLWLFWDDYNRPWKNYQRKFIEMQRDRAERELDAVKKAKGKGEELKALRSKAGKQAKKNADALAKLRQEQIAKAFEHGNEDQRRKFAKAVVDAKKYNYDHASYAVKKIQQKIDAYGEGGKEKYASKLEELTAELKRKGAELDAALAVFQKHKLQTERYGNQLAKIEGQIAELTSEQARLKAETARIEGEEQKLNKRIADLATDAVFEIRNAPFLDMLAPNIKVRQVVLPDLTLNISFAKIQTVDRCMTCHVAIDKKGWDSEHKVVSGQELARLRKAHAKHPDLLQLLDTTWRKARNYTADELLKAQDAYGAVEIIEAKGNVEREVSKKELAQWKSAFGKRLEVKKSGKSYKVTAPNEIKAKATHKADVIVPVEQPFRTHPRLDVYVGSVSAHPMNAFGCRSCHSGLGRATDFLRATHMPDDAKTEKRWKSEYHWKPLKDKFWNKPMYPTSYTEAGCVQCHTDMVELEPMPWMKVGENSFNTAPVAWADKDGGHDYAGKFVHQAQEKFIEHGCGGCHKVEGVDEPKQGPGLVNMADKLDREWVRRWIEDPKGFRPNTRMPQVFKIDHHLDPLKKQEATAQDLGALRGLNGLGKLKKDHGDKQIDKLLKKYKDRKKLFSAIQDAEMDAIVAYLYGNSGSIDMQSPGEDGDAERGKSLFLNKGCLSCHSMDEYSVPGEPGKRFGPNLSNQRSKLGEKGAEWLYTWLKNPKSYHANSRMPDVRLTDDEAKHLTAYLMGKETDESKAFNKRKVKASEVTLQKMRLVNFLEGNMGTLNSWDVVNALTEKQRLMWLGEKVIAKQGCYGCHEMSEKTTVLEELKSNKKAWKILSERGLSKFVSPPAFNTMSGIGVELSDWGNKYLSKLEFGLQKHLQQTRWTFAKTKIWLPRLYDKGMAKAYDDMLRMPWFDFDEQTAQQLATYVTGLKKRDLDPRYRYRESSSNWKLRAFERQRKNRANPLWEKPLDSWSDTDLTLFVDVLDRLAGYKLDRRMPEESELVKAQPGERAISRLVRHASTKGKRVRGQAKTLIEIAELALNGKRPDFHQLVQVEMWREQFEGGLDSQWLDPRERRQAIIEGRKLIRRHNCRGCHQIEGKGGELALYVDKYRKQGAGAYPIADDARQDSPPALNHQGERTQAAWLHAFFRDPEAAAKAIGPVGKDGVLRRWLTMKMPKYGFSVKEANILTRYFAATNGVSYPSESQMAPLNLRLKQDRELLAGAEEMFKRLNCLSCHGDNVTGSHAAPYLEHAGQRLRGRWVVRWLIEPTAYLPYTTMINTTIKDKETTRIWLDNAHREARKYTRVILDPEAVKRIRKKLGN